MRTIVYGDSARGPLPDDGAGEEAHFMFSLSDLASLVASYGPDEVMNQLFKTHPGIYAALSEHFYRDYYKEHGPEGEMFYQH